MSTIKEFENAPVGATATHPDGIRVVKREGYETAYLPWLCTTYGEWFSNEEMAEGGYTLERPVPTNSREALDLAWNLAHEVKEGQTIPGRERTIGRYEDGDFFLGMSLTDRVVTGSEQSHLRTLDPLPDPEPGWLNAPAVLANDHRDRLVIFFPVAARAKYWQSAQTGIHYHWSYLTDVTPLYPKEDTPHDAPRQRTVSFRDDGPWGTRLGGDPA